MKKFIKIVLIIVIGGLVGLFALGLILSKVDPNFDKEVAAQEKSDAEAKAKQAADVTQASKAAGVDESSSATSANGVAQPALAANAKADSTEDDAPLKGHDAGVVYGSYIAQLQTSVMATQLNATLSMSKIKQDIEFQNLDDYRKTAEGFEDAIRSKQEQITSINYATNISDEDDKYFSDALEAANNVLGQYSEVAADIGVNAHTGIDASTYFVKDAKKLKPIEAKYIATVIAGYKHFGVSKSEIDAETLTLKKQF